MLERDPVHSLYRDLNFANHTQLFRTEKKKSLATMHTAYDRADYSLATDLLFWLD